MEQINVRILRVQLRRIIVGTIIVGLLSLWVPNANAGCPKPVSPIRTGEVAVCDGYLFSPEAESEAYKAKRISELQEEENKILQTRLDMYIKQSDILAKEVGKRDNMDGLYKFLYFGLGVVVTGAIAHNVGR